MRVVNATQLLGGRNLIHEGNAVIFKGILMYLSLPSPPPPVHFSFHRWKTFFHPFLPRASSAIKHAARPPCNYTIILS